MTDDLMIEATGLEKSYGAVKVLAGVDLRVERGSVFALLGSNGAGKTTTVRILSTLTRADAGRALVAGFDEVARCLGARAISSDPSRLTIGVATDGSAAEVRACLNSRNLEALLTSLMLPIMLMLLFVYLLGGAIHTGTRYVTYVVPGVLLLCAGFGASTTATSVSLDMTGGIIDRFRSLDVGGPAVLAGHVVASLARNTASTILVFGIAFLIGFRPDAGPLGWLAAAGILLVSVAAASLLFRRRTG